MFAGARTKQWKASACGCGGGEVGRIRPILRSRDREGENRPPAGEVIGAVIE